MSALYRPYCSFLQGDGVGVSWFGLFGGFFLFVNSFFAVLLVLLFFKVQSGSLTVILAPTFQAVTI